MALKKFSKNNRILYTCMESGATMIEMLAVLALIAILAVGAIAFYDSVMATQQAGSLHDDIKMRAILNAERKERQLFSTDMQNHSTYSLPLNVIQNSPVPGYFTINVEDIKPEICQKLLPMLNDDVTQNQSQSEEGAGRSPIRVIRPERIYINNLVYPDGISSCPEEDASIAVAFRSSFATSSDEIPELCSTDDDCSMVTASCSRGECQEPHEPCNDENPCQNGCQVCNTRRHVCENACERKAWLQSNGNSYIPSVVTVQGNTSKVEVDFQFTNTSPTQQRVFGSGTGLVADLYINGNGYFAWAWKNDSGNWTSTNKKANTNRYVFMLDGKNNQVSLKGVGNNVSYSSSVSQTRTKSGEIYLFGYNRNTTNRQLAKVKIYSFKAWNNGQLTRDLVPVSSPSGGCMYDRVQHKLLCGTQPMTAGN